MGEGDFLCVPSSSWKSDKPEGWPWLLVVRDKKRCMLMLVMMRGFDQMMIDEKLSNLDWRMAVVEVRLDVGHVERSRSSGPIGGRMMT